MLRLSPNVPVDDKSYREKLNSTRVLHTPGGAKVLAYWLLSILLLAFIVMFLPWQQNIRAEGELTALNPQDRPQTIEAVIAGRIAEWRVREGQLVKAGDTLARITEVKEKFFDPNLIERLKEQVAAKEANIQSKEQKVLALRRQIAAMREGLTLKLSQTERKIEQKELKVESDSNKVLAAVVDLQVAERQLTGQQVMYDSGLVPLTKLESARMKSQSSQAKIVDARNSLDASRQELLITRLDISTLEAEALDKISKAESDLYATLADISDSEASLAKLRNELANMEIRNQQYYILAPQDGYLVKAHKNGLGETIKEGEALMTIMPENPQLAVALYIKAMDAPLLDTGRHVRLEFDGWPALQFSGWPSVAVGTFGGQVQVIDMVDSKEGKYRVLITPDKKDEDGDWPNELRLGSGVYGWVMLDDVPVYYELWRQLNGFPPSLQSYQDAGEADRGSKEKGGK